MKQILKYMSVATLCAFGPMAQAQESTSETTATEEVVTEETAAETGETTTETTEQDPAASVVNEQDEIFPVAEDNAEPEEGNLYIREEHGDWEVRCLKAADAAAESCRIYQLLLDEDGARVAEINIQPLKNGGKAVAGVDFATPLGTLLTAKVVMRIDSGKPTSYQYNWCDQYGCFSRFGLTEGEVGTLKKGIKATVTIRSVAVPEEAINLNVSLTGFTAGWNAINSK